MQPIDSSRFRSPRPHKPTTQEVDPREEPTPARPGLAPEMPFALSHVIVAAPALLVQARFRDIPLASRLLRADETRAFTIGAARGADAPVNPAYLPPSATPFEPAPFVEPTPGGFAINLAPAMRAELLTPVQALPLRPDFGHAEAPLMLPPDACLRVSCGEVAFDIFAAEPAAVVPPPRFPAGLREHGRYTLGVGLAFLALLLIGRGRSPEDPRSLSLEDIARSGRMVSAVVIPLDINSAGGRQALAARSRRWRLDGRQGRAGEGRRPEFEADGWPPCRRRQGRSQGRAGCGRRDPQEHAARRPRRPDDGFGGGGVRAPAGDRARHGDGPWQPARDRDRERVWHRRYWPGRHGRGGGTNEGTVGVGGFGTLGKCGNGHGPGSGPGYGVGWDSSGVTSREPDPMIGDGIVKGQLDKEIIRRIVRRHLNEVRYCYEQALTKQPKLDGRLVTQFTISGNGVVIARSSRARRCARPRSSRASSTPSSAGSSRRPPATAWPSSPTRSPSPPPEPSRSESPSPVFGRGSG